MPVEVDRTVCVGSASCVEECPVDAISLDDENKAVIDQDVCIECGSCVEACPVEAIDWA